MTKIITLWSISVLLLSFTVVFGVRLLTLEPVKLEVVEVLDLGHVLKGNDKAPLRFTLDNWIAIWVKVTNNGDEVVFFPGFNFVDAKNFKFKHFADMGEYMPGVCTPQKIEPGQALTCVDVFEVPDHNIGPLTVQFAGQVVPLK
jgi:hypothetical protein